MVIVMRRRRYERALVKLQALVQNIVIFLIDQTMLINLGNALALVESLTTTFHLHTNTVKMRTSSLLFAAAVAIVAAVFGATAAGDDES
uniref:Uncharacterized protein n=1 Tax=Oryza punctata TaxID=4537 RepID=A0A0E0KAD1_ORYPU